MKRLLCLILLLLPSGAFASSIYNPGVDPKLVIRNQSSLQSGATFYVSSGTVKNNFYVLGDMISPNGGRFYLTTTAANTTSSPAFFGINSATPGSASLFSMDTNSPQNFVYDGINSSYGNSMNVIGYWALRLRGDHQGGAMDWTSNGTEASTIIQGSQAGDPVLEAKGAASQTGDLFRLVDNNASLLSTFKSDAGYAPASKTIVQFSTTTPASAGILYYCSNCTNALVCISTGTSQGAWAAITSNRTTTCN